MRSRLDPVLPPLMLSPRITKRLPHDARHVSWGREGDVALVIGSDSRFSVVDAELEVVVDGEVRNADLRAGVVDADDASGAGQLAFAARAAFILSDFGATSVSTHTHRAWQPHEGGDVQFLEDGRILCVCPANDGAPAVQIRDASSGLVHEEASARFPPNSRFRLVGTPNPARFLVEVTPLGAASRVYVIRVDDLGLEEVPDLRAEGAGPFVFDSSGVAARITPDGVERWRWRDAGITPLDRWSAADDTAHLEGGALHPELVPLGPDQLLIGEEGGARFHLLEVASMRLSLPVQLRELKSPLQHVLGEPAGDRILLAHGADGVLLSLLEPPFGEVS